MKSSSKRQPRIPLTREELEGMLAIRARKQQMALERFKKTAQFKWCNRVNIVAVFLFSYLIMSFFLSCRWDTEEIQAIKGKHKEREWGDSIRPYQTVSVQTKDDHILYLYVSDVFQLPAVGEKIWIGHDLIFQKRLKARLEEGGRSFFNFNALGYIFLATLALIVNFSVYGFDSHYKSYSLTAITVINGVALIFIILF